MKLWDPASGTSLATLRGHSGEVNCVAFSPDGRTVASAGDDRTVRLWNVAERSLRRVLSGHKDQVVCVRFAPNSQFFASADNSGLVIIWDATTNEPTAQLQQHRGRIEDLDISPDSRLILTGGSDHPPTGGTRGSAARIWDVQLGRETWSHIFDAAGAAQCVSFDRQGGGFIVGDSRGNLARWNRDGQQIDLLDYSSEQLKSAAVSRDGSTIVVAGATRQIIVDRSGSGGRRTTLLHGHRGTIWGLAISPDSKQLASASRDGTIKIWDLGQDCRYRSTDLGPAAGIGARDRSGQLFVDIDRTAERFVVRNANGIPTADVTAEWGPLTAITAAALATEHSLVALGTSDGSLRLCDYRDHRLVGKMECPGGGPTKIGFAAADRVLFAIACGKLRVWNLADRAHPALEAEWPATDVTVSDNGESMAVVPAGVPNGLELWHRGTAGWRKQGTLESALHCPPAFTADGRLVALGDGENTVRIRDIASGRDLNVLKVTSLRNSRIALSPDGRTFVIQALGRLTTWALPAGMPVVDFDLRLKAEHLGFFPDGTAIFVAGWSHVKPQPGGGDPAERYQVVQLPASRVGSP